MDGQPKDVRHPAPLCFGTSITSLGSSFTDESNNTSGRLEREFEGEDGKRRVTPVFGLNPDQQREVAQIGYFRELIERQLVDYQKVRVEVENLEEERVDLKERSKELDRNSGLIWVEAQEAMKKDSVFRHAFQKLMEQEDPTVKHVAQYLQNSIPIREELFETLYVTGRTEKHAVENALDLQVDYRRRIRQLLPTRSQLAQKHRDLRYKFDRLQTQKKAIYDEMLEVIEEIDRVDSQLHLLSTSKMSNSRKE